MQYKCPPVKRNNVGREKELEKNDFALTFVPYCLLILYSVKNKKFPLCLNNLACNLRNFYLFLDSVLFPAKLNFLCCFNTSLTIL